MKDKPLTQPQDILRNRIRHTLGLCLYGRGVCKHLPTTRETEEDVNKLLDLFSHQLATHTKALVEQLEGEKKPVKDNRYKDSTTMGNFGDKMFNEAIDRAITIIKGGK